MPCGFLVVVEKQGQKPLGRFPALGRGRGRFARGDLRNTAYTVACVNSASKGLLLKSVKPCAHKSDEQTLQSRVAIHRVPTDNG